MRKSRVEEKYPSGLRAKNARDRCDGARVQKVFSWPQIYEAWSSFFTRASTLFRAFSEQSSCHATLSIGRCSYGAFNDDWSKIVGRKQRVRINIEKHIFLFLSLNKLQLDIEIHLDKDRR